MLQIRFDHRFERLADALLESFDGVGPFDERVVIVPSSGIGRWLQRRDAQRHGISARLRPEFAGRWLWDTMRAVLDGLPVQSPFAPERVRWHVLALLDELPAAQEFALLARRLGERGSTARLALADSIASIFDRYLAYRRDWLARWQDGRWADGDAPLGAHEGWQRWLWVRLLETLPGVRDEHPYDAFVRVLDEADPARIASALGTRRVAIFGRVDLSPEQFALVGRLSQLLEVSIFAPDPCRELWSDLLDPVSLAQVRAQQPDAAWLYEGEPALLGSWGRTHRDFVAQLLDLEERFEVQADAPGRDEPLPFDADAVADAVPHSTLQALHAAVFLRSDLAWRTVRTIDDSIRVIGAHSTVREAEILHETLLECFAAMPGLQPGEVVVHCADIETAAPAIEGVFESVPPARRIPLVVSGRTRAVDALVTAVEAILAAAVHGVDAPAVERLLRNPALADALWLDESDADELLEWFTQAGARRGLDAQDGAPKHNLQAAGDRLLLGAALGAGQVCGDLLAVPGAQGSRARKLDGWLVLLEVLTRLRALGRQARAAREWCEVLGDALETLFARTHAHAAALQRVRETLDQLGTTSDEAAGTVLEAAAFAKAFADAIAQGAPAAVPGGAVTVVPVGSLRGVPFRVLCLFGFDERAFPRRGARDELDLMRAAPRFGDRLARNDDRGAFLDAVLAARERLVVSCCSRDPRDDSALNPSSLVTELLSYLGARLAGEAGAAPAGLPRARRGDALLRPALVEQPLHPFSRRNFEGDEADRADEWLPTAIAADTPLATRSPGIGPLFAFDAPLAPLEPLHGESGLAVERVVAALADPARTWLRETMRIALPVDEAQPPENEPLWPQAAEDALLVQRCVDGLLAGGERARIVREIAFAPATPAGAAGTLDAETAVDQAEALIARALAASERLVTPAQLVTPGRPEPVLARVGESLLRMSPPVLDSQGRLLFVSAWSLTPWALIDAWLRTALWCFVLDPKALGCLVTKDEVVEVRCADPLRGLEHAIEWSRRITAQPLALFPRSWLRYARALAGNGRRTADSIERTALAQAQKTLAGDDSGHVKGELLRPEMRALYRDADIDFERVLPLCEQVYRPVFDDTSLAGVERES